MIVIGIDPGISGAVMALDKNGKIYNGFDIPVIKDGKRNTIDIDKFRHNWIDFKGVFCHVMLEKAQAMPGQGVVSVFNYGKAYGIILGLIAGFNTPYTLVHPRTWKAVMLRDMNKQSKDASRLRAKQLWPVGNWFDRKQDEHRAEAALLAEYGRRLLCRTK